MVSDLFILLPKKNSQENREFHVRTFGYENEHCSGSDVCQIAMKDIKANSQPFSHFCVLLKKVSTSEKCNTFHQRQKSESSKT